MVWSRQRPIEKEKAGEAGRKIIIIFHIFELSPA
jgi:hypothetical protein